MRMRLLSRLQAKHRETGEIVALKAMQLSTLEQAGQVEGGEGVPLQMMHLHMHMHMHMRIHMHMHVHQVRASLLR